MSSFGSMDARDLLRFAKRFEKLTDQDIDAFMQDCARALAALLLAKVIPRTPVGEVNGGSLRRGWTAHSEEEAVAGRKEDPDIDAWVESLNVRRNGTNYEMIISNPMFYGPYVEYGHRTSNGTGWVEGQYMLTISEKEIFLLAPAELEMMLFEFLMELFL